MNSTPERAVLFIDGNNWFHSLVDWRIPSRGDLDYSKISLKLVGPRIWVETRYYIGKVPQGYSRQLYSDQRRFIDSLKASDPRITAHLGRLERRPVEDQAAKALNDYLSSLKTRIDPRVYVDLKKIAQDNSSSTVLVEKAVDVNLAIDLVSLAHCDAYDVAYLLTADGDFTPAARLARSLNRKVFAVSLDYGAQLAAEVNSFIRLAPDWFVDCYRAP